MADDIILIANPAAGGGRARTAALHAAELFDRRGATVQLTWTSAAGHATRLAEDAVQRGASRVVACGGDGTLNEIAVALKGGSTAVGVIPAGRGNDFAKALGLPLEVRDAVNGIMMSRERQIDLGEVNGRVFLTVAAVGFDGEVAQRVARGSWSLLGSNAYIGGTLQTLLGYRASTMTIRGDFGERSGKYLLVATGNTACYGGGIRITPEAVPDDGVFDCCLIRNLPRWKLLQLLPSAFTGQHVRQPECEMVQTRTLDIIADPAAAIAADGEAVGRTRATLRVLPGALRVLTPA